MNTPAFFPASTRFNPFSTVTSRPSTLIFTVAMSRPSMERAALQRAPLLADVLEELVLELFHEAPGGPRRGVSQGADGVALDVVGDGEENPQIPLGPLARLDLPEEPLQPTRSLAAGGALAARLVREETRRDPRRAHHADRVVHDDRGPGAEERARARQRVEVHGDVDLFPAQDRTGGAAWDHRLDRAPAGNAAAVFLDQHAERGPHRRLVDAGLHHVARHSVQLGPGVPLGPDPRAPLPPAPDDVRHAGKGLHVVDHGGAPEEALDRRKGGLQARPSALPLQRLDHARLLAADVGAGAHVHRDLAVEAGTQDVPPDQSGGARLLDGAAQDLGLGGELAADVDVGAARPDRVRADQRPLEELMRILLADQPVLERARLALVGVHAHVFLLVGRLGDEAPLC